jgi:hypothetical protein
MKIRHNEKKELFFILLGCDGRPQPISGQSTTPMSSGVFSVRIEKGIDFFGIGIEDHGG